MTTSTSIRLDVRMPAEWEPHLATWIAWPHNQEDWPGKFETIDWVYADFVAQLSHVERVRILVPGAGIARRLRPILDHAGAQLDAIDFYNVPTNRSWTRDFVGTFVKALPGGESRESTSPIVIDWQFSGWAKYPNHQRDNAVTATLARALDFTHVQPLHHGRPVVLEGGSIEVNGSGLLLTTEECLLSNLQVRNPGLTRQDYEEIFSHYLGVEKTLWLKNGITGDDTHGHIDDLARFVSADTVVTVVEEDPGDENYVILQENLDLLRSFTDQQGRKLNVHTLPMPGPIFFADQRLPASYANFYIANETVFVPTFNDPNDRHALNTLADLFPDHEVIGIHSVDLVLGLGTLHCMTQQQPR